MPVGLRNNRHLVTGSFERPADDGCAKGRMVNIGIAGEEDDIQLVPSTEFHFLLGSRQEVGQLVS